jgi:glycolate oxidase iron-sulfur subunit
MKNQEIQKKYFYGMDIPDEAFLIKCMHCGLCLPTCPTFKLTGRERSSPRGRIRLIKSVNEGKLEISKTFFEEMNYCLDCQACETACPAGVKYGGLVEMARVQIETSKWNPVLRKVIKNFIFKVVFTRKSRVKLLARLLRFYQKSGLRFFVQKTGILRLFSKKLYNIEGLAPDVSPVFSDDKLPERLMPTKKSGKKVGFFYGCFMNVMFADINFDTITVLLENNYEIIVPVGQECCGSMHAHNGDIETARRLAKANIDAFNKHELDAIIVNAAGCSAFMKEYAHVLKNDKEYKDKSVLFTEKVKDIMEYLVENDIKKPDKIINKKITYHDACHHVHTQKIYGEPRDLLKKIDGLELTELKDSTACCGSAGIYNVLNYEDSMKILDEKLENIKNTGADIVLVANPGCLAQLRYGIERKKMDVKALHPITLIKESYSK